jgi:tetratricopeptide (TPR) repeat protein
MAAPSCTHAQCGMRLTGPVPPGLQQCGACRKVAYCSKACQKEKWKNKHKRECAALRAGELTAHQEKVIDKLNERHFAQDDRCVVALKVEASEVAADVRTSHSSLAAAMYAMLGSGHMHVQEHQDAIELLNTGMTIYEDIRSDELAASHKTDDRQYLCNACCNLATCYRETSCFEKALVLYDRALVIGEEVGDRQALGGVMRDLGALYQLLGQHDEAIGLLEKGSAIANEVGDRLGHGASCLNLAQCYQAMGQYEKAITFGEQGAVIFEDLGDLRCLIYILMVLGQSWALLGNYAQAIKHHTKQWDLSQRQDHVKNQAQAALNMGVTLWTQGLAEHHAAEDAAQAADGGLQMQKQIAERLGKAYKWLTTARDRNDICRVTVVVGIEQGVNLNLACVAFFTGQEAQALKYLHKYLEFSVQHARGWCAGCGQRRGEDAPMLTCGGCRVARSVLQLLAHAPSHHLPCPPVSVCARAQMLLTPPCDRFCNTEHQKMASKKSVRMGTVRHKNVCGLLKTWTVTAGDCQQVWECMYLCLCRCARSVSRRCRHRLKYMHTQTHTHTFSHAAAHSQMGSNKSGWGRRCWHSCGD